MNILSVRHLHKQYPDFALQDVSFALPEGYIMGFIGRNGAGKTTTIKCMLDIARKESGEVEIFGKDFYTNQTACKQNIGLVLGGVDYYPKAKIKTITNVVRRFYTNWSDADYAGYLKRFELNEDKTVEKLSAGMKVKYALALALSHHPQLLILDEPTSGLDPVSREDLLDLFREYIEDGKRSILFSTHITSDLDKCADYITYIKEGRLVLSEEKDALLGEYLLVRGGKADLEQPWASQLIGAKPDDFGYTAIIHRADLPEGADVQATRPGLDSFMVHYERSNTHEESAI